MTDVVVVSETQPTPDAVPPVVVVETPAVAESADDTAVLVSIAATLGALVERIDRIETATAAAQQTADSAEFTAEAAIEIADAAGSTAALIAEEVATPAEVEEIVEDVPPAAKPWFVKSASELRSNGQ